MLWMHQKTQQIIRFFTYNHNTDWNCKFYNPSKMDICHPFVLIISLNVLHRIKGEKTKQMIKTQVSGIALRLHLQTPKCHCYTCPWNSISVRFMVHVTHNAMKPVISWSWFVISYLFWAMVFWFAKPFIPIYCPIYWGKDGVKVYSPLYNTWTKWPDLYLVPL